MTSFLQNAFKFFSCGVVYKGRPLFWPSLPTQDAILINHLVKHQPTVFEIAYISYLSKVPLQSVSIPNCKDAVSQNFKLVKYSMVLQLTNYLNIGFSV